MGGKLHDLVILTKRSLLGLVLRLPPGWRARLSHSRLLTRIFLFLDVARYLPTSSERDPDGQHPIHITPTSLSSRQYRYQPPLRNAEVESELAQLTTGPLVSIIMPVFDTPPEVLKAAVRSVVEQWYPHWELCIADDCSTSQSTLACLESLHDPRIRTLRLPVNGGIVTASNAALGMARGEFIALLDHDDLLTPDALYESVRLLLGEDFDFVYSDEDKLEADGSHSDPHFKSDFAPDTLRSHNYLSHFGVLRKSLFAEVGGFRPGLDGAQDYDLYLRVADAGYRIGHVRKVLYHWRKSAGSTASRGSAKDYAWNAGKLALEASLQRRGMPGNVQPGLHPGTYRVRHAISGRPLISIIIPFRDRADLLETCVQAIHARTSWQDWELIGLDNGSVEADTRKCMDRLLELDSRIRFHDCPVPFNFSKLNNLAVRDLARGEHVVLMNNDIEVTSPDWIEALLQFSQREDVGAVGAKLYYPGGRVQHAGIILGLGGVAGHSHKYFPGNTPGYAARLLLIQNLSAVTAALMMVKRRTWLDAGGMDEEHLGVAFNDVDFCLRLREQGLLNVFTPYCEAIHHESLSRGREDSADKLQRFMRETRYMLDRHAGVLTAGDPYYNPNLSLEREDFSLRVNADGVET